MLNPVFELKKEIELKLSSLRIKRKDIIERFKKKLQDAKIDQLKKNILEK